MNAMQAIDSVFIPIEPGKPDPQNPGGRKLQKGAVDNACLWYAFRMITPRRGGADYLPEMRATEKILSEWRKDPYRALPDVPKYTQKYIQAFERVFQKMNISKREIFNPLLQKNLVINQEFRDANGHLSRDKLFDEFIKCLSEGQYKIILLATIQKIFRNTFNLKVSRYVPQDREQEDFNQLIEVLKESGPMIVIGHYGSNYYNVAPKLIQDPITGSAWGWVQPRLPNNELVHTVVICGASMIEDAKGKLHRRVYFYDPNDASGPDPSGALVPRKLYVMSFKTLREHESVFERLELPLTPENLQSGYGIQRNI